MKSTIFFVFCLVAVFSDSARSNPINEQMDNLSRPFEKLIKSEIHEILENFFTFVKELIGNVTNGQNPGLITPPTTTAHATAHTTAQTTTDITTTKASATQAATEASKKKNDKNVKKP